MNNLPSITFVKISFIRAFALNNFVEKHQNLDQQFNFLANCDYYSEYYKNLEASRNNADKNFKSIEINGLGPLMPLKKRHTLNSYWKSFRLPLKNEKNKSKNELFLLLPLKIKIHSKSIKAHGEVFPTEFYAYLFPFGCCCINMEINMPSPDFRLDKLPEVISDIKRSNFSAEEQSFKPYSLEIAKKINKALFADENGIKGDRSTINTLVYLKTNIGLKFKYPEHKNAIAAIMSDKISKEKLLALSEANFNEEIGCALKIKNEGEILLFNPQRTFIYPKFCNTQDVGNDKQIKEKQNARTLKCMYNNYCSFLNVMFAVNRFLKDSFLVNGKITNNLPNERILEIVKCFTIAFQKAPDNEFNNVYFHKIFDDIASRISLDKHLNDIWSKFNDQN